MARADKLTIEKSKVEYYSDFLNNFEKNPVTGFLARVTNEESVKQSIRNIILTRRGERFYDPLFGSEVMNALFEPMDEATFIAIKESIFDSINNFEPRAILKDVYVRFISSQNAVSIKIIFSIKNYISDSFNLDLIISRVR